MKKYRVNVNGEMFEIEVELLGDVPATAVAPAAAPAAAPAPEVAPAPAAAGGEAVNCPMPGTILAVNVNAGDSIKKGQVLFILEAMKMENEIMASRDGVVASVSVTKGASVQTGDVLCTIQ